VILLFILLTQFFPGVGNFKVWRSEGNSNRKEVSATKKTETMRNYCDNISIGGIGQARRG